MKEQIPNKPANDEKKPDRIILEIVKLTLKNIHAKKKRPLNVGDIVITLEGDYDGIGLMIVEELENGMVRLSPGPNSLANVEIHKNNLYRTEDLADAWKTTKRLNRKFTTQKPH